MLSLATLPPLSAAAPLASCAAAESGGSVASESINGYSYSYDRTAQQEAVRLNAKSAAARKIAVIKLYNDYDAGVRR